jgi:hypothetical protein
LVHAALQKIAGDDLLTTKPPAGKKPRKKTVPPPSEKPAIAEEAPLPPRQERLVHRADEAPFAECTGLSPANVAVLLECNAEWTEGMAQMGQAMLGLTRETLQGAAETSLALIDSRSLPSAWALGIQLAHTPDMATKMPLANTTTVIMKTLES